MVIRQTNFLGQMRVDVPLLRAMESSVAADFDLAEGTIFAGRQGLVVKGFALTNIGVGLAAGQIQCAVAGSVLVNFNSTESGSMFSVPADRANETISATNPKVSGAFTSSATNFIGVDLRRQADDTTSDVLQFLNATTLIETSKTVPLARTLDYRFVISTSDFASQPNLTPLAKVVTDASNNIVSVQDARQLAFRLGQGGDFPDRFAFFPWAGGRAENLIGDVFSGGDKIIQSQKDWQNAVMTRMWELGGGEYWYAATADRNVNMIWLLPYFTNGENFEWDGTHLHWQGIRFIFDNSTGYYNDVKDQVTNSVGLTNLADGECIYVDLDRTQNFTNPSGLQAAKAVLTTLGPGSRPGARNIMAWRVGGNVYTRGWRYPVGTLFLPATPTSMGMVKLNEANLQPLTPIVVSVNATGGIVVGVSYPVTSNTVAAVKGVSGTTWGGFASGVWGQGSATTATQGIQGLLGLGGDCSANVFAGTGVTGDGGNSTGAAGTGGYGGNFFGGAGGTTGFSSGGGGIQAIGGGATGHQGGTGVFGFGGESGSKFGGYGVVGQGGTGTGGGSTGGVGGQFSGGNANGGWGVIGAAGSGSNGKGVQGTGDGTGDGVTGYGAFGGSATGVQGYGSNGSAGFGVKGLGGDTSGIGVQGIGGGGINSHGVQGQGGAAPGSLGGTGGDFTGGTGAQSGAGVSGTSPASAIGGSGGTFQGGNSTASNNVGGKGAYGQGGNGHGTGNGGDGVVGLGGGPGASGAGGRGVVGTGVLTSPGGDFTGGTSGGRGVQGQGGSATVSLDAGAGVHGTGGGSGDDGFGSGLRNPAPGVVGVGGDAEDPFDGAHGVEGYGGSGDSGGDGVFGFGGNGPFDPGNGGFFRGAPDLGSGPGIGVWGQGGVGSGGSGGIGGNFVGGNDGASGYGVGIRASAGLSATGATRRVAIQAVNGDVSLDGVANPNSNVAFKNKISPKNIAKAWVVFHTSNTGVPYTATIDDAFNVDHVTVNSSAQFTVTFAQGFSGTNNYAGLVTPWQADLTTMDASGGGAARRFTVNASWNGATWSAPSGTYLNGAIIQQYSVVFFGAQ